MIAEMTKGMMLDPHMRTRMVGWMKSRPRHIHGTMRSFPIGSEVRSVEGHTHPVPHPGGFATVLGWSDADRHSLFGYVVIEGKDVEGETHRAHCKPTCLEVSSLNEIGRQMVCEGIGEPS